MLMKGGISMQQMKHYTEADIKFTPSDAQELKDVLAYLNNPKVDDDDFKARMARLGPREMIKRSDEALLQQYRYASINYPRHYYRD